MTGTLHRGDPIAVLGATSGRGDPLSLALRGVALAQLDEVPAARAHLTRAALAFDALGDARSALRARVAEAEVALLENELTYARRALVALAARLFERGDRGNAAWALVVAARGATLQGDREGADLLLARASRERSPLHVATILAVARAEQAARDLDAKSAHRHAARALALAARTEHAALVAEVEAFARGLTLPIACDARGAPLVIGDVERCFSAPDRVIVDACRARVGARGAWVDLASRPALFDLALLIARSAPGDVSVDEVAREVFGARASNASHDARLRVDLGRLRPLLAPLAIRIVLARRRLQWLARDPLEIVMPLVPRREARLLALVADGRSYAAQALADALGQSPRTAQRLLTELTQGGKLTALGRGRARRYALPSATPRFASQMLLLGMSSLR